MNLTDFYLIIFFSETTSDSAHNLKNLSFKINLESLQIIIVQKCNGLKVAILKLFAEPLDIITRLSLFYSGTSEHS